MWDLHLGTALAATHRAGARLPRGSVLPILVTRRERGVGVITLFFFPISL